MREKEKDKEREIACCCGDVGIFRIDTVDVCLQIVDETTFQSVRVSIPVLGFCGHIPSSDSRSLHDIFGEERV